MRQCCKHQCIKYCPLQQKWTIAKSLCQAMWSTFYYSNCVRGADLLAFQQEFRADFKSHAGVKRMKRSAGVVLQKQPAARSAFVNIIIIWKRCQMLAFMPTETSSWEKCSLKFAITPAAFKPSILDQKNHFSFFLFSPSHKAQLSPGYNMMVSPLHLLEDGPAHPVPTVLTTHPTSTSTSIQTHPWNTFPDSQQEFPHPIPSSYNLLKSSHSTASIPPPAPSKVPASQITPLDPSYLESL